jgi:hypothetical protein
MNKNQRTSYLMGLFSIGLALAFMVLPINNALAQNNNGIGRNMPSMSTMAPGSNSKQNPWNPLSMSSSENWTGSVSLLSPIIDAYKSKIHTTLNDAITSAKNVVGGSNSTAVAAFIHPQRGFLVYDVFVLDSSNNIHRVIVDPGNGRVLSNLGLSMQDMMSMMHSSMGMGGMMDNGGRMMDNGGRMMGSFNGPWH